MTVNVKRYARLILAALAIGVSLACIFLCYVPSSKMVLPEFPANKDGRPQAIIKLEGNRDFGWWCGSIIPVSIVVRCPNGWEPEADSLTVKGDLEPVDIKVTREQRPDALYVRFDVSLQTVNPKDFKWEALSSLKFKTGGKLESVDFPPIRVSGSPTFDGNKKAPIKVPETQYVFGNHTAITIAMLVIGGLGTLVFPVLLLRSFRRAPTAAVAAAEPVVVISPERRLRNALAAVIGGDWVSADFMKELALTVREYFNVPENKFPSALINSDCPREQLVGRILEICEGPYIWKDREFVPDRDIDRLRTLGALVLDLPASTFNEKLPVDIWQDERGEPQADAQPVAENRPALTDAELEAIALEALSGG